MLRDASQRQAIQKFSFIRSLDLSRASQSQPSELGKLNTDRAFCFQQRQKPESGKLATQKSQQPAAIIATSETTATIDRHWYAAESDYSLSLAEIVNSSTGNSYLNAGRNSDYSSSARRIGKIIFALACSYGLFVSYWLFGHQGSKLLTMLTGGKQIVLSKSEVEFIDYMERSLAQIDRQIAARDKNDGEVVYVPVYTPNQAVNNTPLSALPSSTLTRPAPPAPLAIPAPPPLPSPTPISSSPSPSPSVEIATKPQINHTLTGILELGGDRSAALIKVGGKTRRIWLGEKIHADGWILESVGSQQATIELQGQVRSISVGETF